MQSDVDRIHELDRKLYEAGQAAERAGSTYNAHMQLFNVAVSAKDEKAMEEHRLALHTMLDAILDCGVNVARMNEERCQLAVKVMRGF